MQFILTNEQVKEIQKAFETVLAGLTAEQWREILTAEYTSLIGEGSDG